MEKIMLTPYIDRTSNVPMYMQLYESIRGSIIDGTLVAGQKLPSKRGLAQHLEISVFTIETAYQQLMVEGYVRSEEKRGYYVLDVGDLEGLSRPRKTRVKTRSTSSVEPEPGFHTNLADPDLFPSAVWARLSKDVITQTTSDLLNTNDPQGFVGLREAIADHVFQYRGIRTDASRIVIGAGSESLIPLIVRLLGNGRSYALEDPGYPKTAALYEASGVRLHHIGLDQNGLMASALQRTDADVAHIAPSHQFPSGIVMPVQRRAEILAWAKAKDNRHVIEDDYDTEFRFQGRPVPALMTLDKAGHVIYMNTFSKSLAPSFRISYMILPDHLLESYNRIGRVHACGVPGPVQRVLARFMQEGHFERHINRVRVRNRTKAKTLADILAPLEKVGLLSVFGAENGLHMVVHLKQGIREDVVIGHAKTLGVAVSGLKAYHKTKNPMTEEGLVIGYSGLSHADVIRHGKSLRDAISLSV